MARPMARFGCAGGAPGGRAVVAMVASSAQAIFRSGLPLSSSCSRWSPSRTYHPPSGSLADRPARLDGPRENNGTGVASRAGEPSKAARSSSSRTEMLASISALTRDSSRSRAAWACAVVSCLVRALRSWSLSRRFLGSGEGSATADLVEAVADPAVGGQERLVGGGGAGDAEQARDAGDSWQNSSRVASVRNSGRSSSARHSSAVSTARTGSGRRRPVRWASAASMTGAFPLRSISSAANATACSSGALPGPGMSSPPPLHQRAWRRLSQARKTALGGAPPTWRA